MFPTPESASLPSLPHRIQGIGARRPPQPLAQAGRFFLPQILLRFRVAALALSPPPPPPPSCSTFFPIPSNKAFGDQHSLLDWGYRICLFRLGSADVDRGAFFCLLDFSSVEIRHPCPTAGFSGKILFPLIAALILGLLHDPQPWLG